MAWGGLEQVGVCLGGVIPSLYSGSLVRQYVIPHVIKQESFLPIDAEKEERNAAVMTKQNEAICGSICVRNPPRNDFDFFDFPSCQRLTQKRERNERQNPRDRSSSITPTVIDRTWCAGVDPDLGRGWSTNTHTHTHTHAHRA